MKVLVVDDDNIVSESLKIILNSDKDIEVVGTGGSGKARERKNLCRSACYHPEPAH